MAENIERVIASRVYTNNKTVEDLENEVAELVKARSPEPPKEQEQATDPLPTDHSTKTDVKQTKPPAAEEESYKKRYSDLRRHLDKKEKEAAEQISTLKRQIDDLTRKEIKLPKTDAEVGEWMKEYPDLAAIVETIAIKKAQETRADLDRRLTDIQEREETAATEVAYAKLLKAHSDFEEIRADPAFHLWVNEQPRFIKEALYDNTTDWLAAARALDLYKADVGLLSAKKDPKADKDAEVRKAAEHVKPAPSLPPQPNDQPKGRVYKESEIAKMRTEEYVKLENDIHDAMRTPGRFVYDVSGAAR